MRYPELDELYYGPEEKKPEPKGTVENGLSFVETCETSGYERMSRRTTHEHNRGRGQNAES